MTLIDPAAPTIVRRVTLPGCQHPHDLAIDSPDRVAFVACDQNAAEVTVDETTWSVTERNPVGEDPDVLADGSSAQRLYVAAESGTVATLELRDHTLAVTGSAHLGNGAHVVAVDERKHLSF